MTTEMWRVNSLVPFAPAHRVALQHGDVRIMACNWVPSRPGVYITRAEMLRLSRFCCTKCARSVPAGAR